MTRQRVLLTDVAPQNPDFINRICRTACACLPGRRSESKVVLTGENQQAFMVTKPLSKDDSDGSGTRHRQSELWFVGCFGPGLPRNLDPGTAILDRITMLLVSSAQAIEVGYREVFGRFSPARPGCGPMSLHHCGIRWDLPAPGVPPERSCIAVSYDVMLGGFCSVRTATGCCWRLGRGRYLSIGKWSRLRPTGDQAKIGQE